MPPESEPQGQSPVSDGIDVIQDDQAIAAARFPLFFSNNPAASAGHKKDQAGDMASKHAQHSLFDPKDFLAKAGSGRAVAQYDRDQTIFSQGDAADSVFYVLKGKVKVSVLSEQGKEAVVAIIGKDEFLGEISLTEQKRWNSTATAMTDCEIMRIEKQAFVQALNDEPAFSHLFVAHLLTRSIRVQDDLVDQLFNSSEKRLARALLILANYGEEGAPEPVIAKVTHETLAEMIGTTRSRVSFFMNKFRKQGFISYNGKLRIHKSLLNLVLHENPHIKT